MIRPVELEAIRRGEVDLAFRRWDRPRVLPGTRLRTAVGLVEVVTVDQVTVSSLRASDARRSGHGSLASLREAVAARADRPLFRVELRHAGADPRDALREQVPDADEVVEILAGLDRLDAASRVGPWTRETLRIIDEFPERRAPELAAELERPTAEFKRDVRKLKERGLTESLAIGYRLSHAARPCSTTAVRHGPGDRGAKVRRSPAPSGRPRPGPAGRRAAPLQTVAARSRAEVAALHGVRPPGAGTAREPP